MPIEARIINPENQEEEFMGRMWRGADWIPYFPGVILEEHLDQHLAVSILPNDLGGEVYGLPDYLYEESVPLELLIVKNRIARIPLYGVYVNGPLTVEHVIPGFTPWRRVHS